MDFLKEWVANIIFFILLATVLDMLLPNSAMQKYVKIVTGLLLIAIILSPVLKIFSGDFDKMLENITSESRGEENHQMESLIEMKKTEIQASQHAYILEQMAVQLKADAEEELMEQHGMAIAAVDIKVNERDKRSFPENLELITVHLKEASGNKDGAVPAVQEVKIDTEQPLPSSKRSKRNEEAASLLAEKWNVPENSIQIVSEGRLLKQ
ncbi:stage III sporulation protein AF [Mesobacillus zeae]|uniref:Stage III sporulation protein AF n=1 Tax=Mesobacillus zeae TaxID=1917180 RepID=A0A398B229_9BACI|nr:stage III sporulation protein AF [Mesobacillus zeae]RID83907.1 stage III sporulation protein AF [Mesobacillus zeae]